MQQKIDTLDHGFVRLVDSMGSDLSIVRNARVSYDAEWRAGEDSGSDERLLKYLLSNGHTSPFEAVTFTFDVKAPIFIFRQWHRHRTWSYNELSARYRELPEEYYVPDYYVIGKQSEHNKQMRDIIAFTPDQEQHAKRNQELIQAACSDAFVAYKELIARGVPRELARGVLPLNTYSHMFGVVNLHNLFKFLEQRLHPHAQYEIRVYAEAMLALIEPIVPISVKTWRNLRSI